ncbi:Cryptochrome DASH, chloroplastic/mitochondrial [Linum grandiflorum]
MAAALLSSSRFLFLSPANTPPSSFRRRNSFHFRCCSAISASTPGRRNGDSMATAIVWFKQDLRVDDHPGIVDASRFQSIVPVYVFDHRILSRYSDEMLELVLFALEDLRTSLIRLGSNLMIRFGDAESVIRSLAQEVRSSNVIVEEEVEYHLLKIVEIVEKTLTEMPLAAGNSKIMRWRTPFYDVKNLTGLPANYEEFKKLKLPITSPVPQPPNLPGSEFELDWGALPTMDQLKGFMDQNPSKLEETWSSVKKISTESILRERNKVSKSVDSLNRSLTKRNKLKNTVFITQDQNFVGGGSSSVLNGLAAYLRYLEGTARDDWQEVHAKLRSAETRDGASFPALFGPALSLGIISRRKVYTEAIRYDRERNGGFQSPFGYSTATIAAAVNAVSSMEWYWLMALKRQLNEEGLNSTRIWRWNGYLVQYTVAGNKGPPVLLVHGFGAFLEHYRDNVHQIAEGGNRVWAITLLGFGKSEKPSVVYTELLWAELLRDFILEVVREPVHLVGNSIGGYVASIASCFWPLLVRSIVLVNSAGNIVPGYRYLPFTKERRINGAAWLGARAILFYLRSNIRSIVRNCYPTKPDRVDDWLLNEMIRASCDPGVAEVLESVFSFNLSLPLNYLLEGFTEQVLIIQGMKDPISDSKSKVAMLKEHCPGFVIKQLDAGHCPHDEMPDEVNSIVCEWTAMIESQILAPSFS